MVRPTYAIAAQTQPLALNTLRPNVQLPYLTLSDVLSHKVPDFMTFQGLMESKRKP